MSLARTITTTKSGLRYPIVLKGLALLLGAIGIVFWYFDYRHFHDPRDLVVGSARASGDHSARGSKKVTIIEDSTDVRSEAKPGTLPSASTSPTIRDAQQLIENGDPAAAAALLEDFLKTHPDDVQALMELAMIHILDLKNSERARQLLEQVVKIDGGHRQALNELVNLYSDPTRTDDGLLFLQSQIDLAADAGELHYAYGRILAMAGQTTEALAHYDQVKGLKDIQDQVYVDAAQAAIQSGNYDRAFDSYRKALKLQEEELARSREQGNESANFIEDRIFSTKIEWARMLIRTGRSPQARDILDGIVGHDDDPNMVSLRSEMSTNSFPM